LKALKFIPAAAAALALAGFAAPAASAAPVHNAAKRDAPKHDAGARDDLFTNGGAVFVQTDNVNGNSVVAYRRAADGTLTQAGTYPTGGVGGVLSGSAVDHLASQGSLNYDAQRGLLFAVNAGSDTVSVFAVRGDRLVLLQVIGSGGTYPVSVAVHGDLVYVLNALNGGSVAGYRLFGDFLLPMPGSTRTLGLDPTATPQFVNTPGQAAFTPDGTHLIVTTKANGNDIDVFAVRADGRLSSAPVVNSEPGDVPFGISYDRLGHVLIANAGNDSVASYSLDRSGHLAPLGLSMTGQAATCWIVRAGQYFYASNAGSGSLSGYAVGSGGGLTALGNTATDAGTVDATSADQGRFVYAQTGAAGIVDEFAVGSGGALTKVGAATVPGAVGGEGIAAS
jgi:6-phosphogluconolactonase (cycloisomerase 2 family)